MLQIYSDSYWSQFPHRFLKTIKDVEKHTMIWYNKEKNKHIIKCGECGKTSDIIFSTIDLTLD
jgi:Fe2+ or Zn2+ uptake regulation protein